MSNIVTIEGTVNSIKNTRQFKHTNTTLVEFIVISKDDKNFEHHYILRAMSKDCDYDKFGIDKLIGHSITAECWLNGRRNEGDKGPYFSNDLNVRKLTL